MTPDREDAPGGREAWRAATFTVAGLVAVAVLWALRDVLVLVGFAALLAFAIEPAVAWLASLRFRRGGISRPFAAALVMIGLVGLGVWALVRVVPQ
ncbi:MAG: hypothetical protein ACRENJ_10055, partial [Candidatus Eiseniibacteriota bacterium]